MIFVDESLNAQLFSNSLVLEELMLSNCCMAKTKGFSPSENYHDLDRFRRRECLLQQLKAVEVREIDGKHEDLDMIKYVLRNSPALQKMTIAFSSGLPQCRRDRVTKKILMLPKVSACSVINFLA
ncbi:hypothetical protein MKW92_027899 [Papaver armeniacum]|nr:hypothetical protein MKW92_027899 [Papaver armeniacum]